jgi:hypothetical protein
MKQHQGILDELGRVDFEPRISLLYHDRPRRTTSTHFINYTLLPDGTIATALSAATA